MDDHTLRKLDSSSVGRLTGNGKPQSEICGAGVGTTYELAYFNLRGRAENARMLFHLARVAFADKRITHEEWPTSVYKAIAPFGQLPILEVKNNDETSGVWRLCQQHAIDRYLARIFDLYGQSQKDRARIDMLLECLRDGTVLVQKLYSATDSERGVLLAQFLGGDSVTSLPHLMRYLRTHIKGPFFLGDNVSLADVAIYTTFEYIKMFSPAAVEDEPSMKELCKRFESLPLISSYLRNRPQTM